MGCPAEKSKTQDTLTMETLALASLNHHCCVTAYFIHRRPRNTTMYKQTRNFNWIPWPKSIGNYYWDK